MPAPTSVVSVPVVEVPRRARAAVARSLAPLRARRPAGLLAAAPAAARRVPSRPALPERLRAGCSVRPRRGDPAVLALRPVALALRAVPLVLRPVVLALSL